MTNYLNNLEEKKYLTMPSIYAPQLLGIDPEICRRSLDNTLIVWDADLTPEQIEQFSAFENILFYTHEAILELMESEAWRPALDIIQF